MFCIDIVLCCRYNKNRNIKLGVNHMGVLQVRVDDELKNQAIEILDTIGIDLSPAVRMFLKKVIMERGIPFDTRIDESSLKFKMAIREMQRISEENGNSEMTLDEINEEIRLAREERRKRKEVK